MAILWLKGNQTDFFQAGTRFEVREPKKPIGQPTTILTEELLAFPIDPNGTNTTAHSVDGVNWTAGSNAYSVAGDWKGLAYSPSLNRWVACGGASPSPPTPLAYSDDGGNTWTFYDPDSGDDRFHRVIWIEEFGRFYAGREFVGGSGPAIISSQTGLPGSWSTSDTNSARSYNFGYSESQGILVSCGNGGTNFRIRYTENGTSWSTGAESGVTDPGTVFAVVWDEDRGLWFCAHGNPTPIRFMSIPDIRVGSWTALGTFGSVGTSYDGAIAIKPGGSGQPIVVAGSTRFLYTSLDDGATFTSTYALPNASGNTFWDVIWSDYLQMFIAVGAEIVTSPDGVNWTAQSQTSTIYGAVKSAVTGSIVVPPSAPPSPKVIELLANNVSYDASNDVTVVDITALGAHYIGSPVVIGSPALPLTSPYTTITGQEFFYSLPAGAISNGDAYIIYDVVSTTANRTITNPENEDPLELDSLNSIVVRSSNIAEFRYGREVEIRNASEPLINKKYNILCARALGGSPELIELIVLDPVLANTVDDGELVFSPNGWSGPHYCEDVPPEWTQTHFMESLVFEWEFHDGGSPEPVPPPIIGSPNDVGSPNDIGSPNNINNIITEDGDNIITEDGDFVVFET